MWRLRQLLMGILCLLRARRAEDDLERELLAHLTLLADEYERQGMGPAEARTAARQTLGGVEQTKELHREARSLPWLDALWLDLRHGLRSLCQAPGFATTAVLILSLGIGVNLTYFQILNLQLLQPLDVRDPDSLVRFERMWRVPDTNRVSISSNVPYPAIQFLRSNNDVLSAVLIQLTDNEVVWGDDGTDRVRGQFVSANYFDELGYSPTGGRLFHKGVDDDPDAEPVVVLGHQFWMARLGGNPDIVGETVRINNRSAVVIGIAPPGYPGLGQEGDKKVWLPIDQIDYFNLGSTFKTNWNGRTGDVWEAAARCDRPDRQGSSPIRNGATVPGPAERDSGGRMA